MADPVSEAPDSGGGTEASLVLEQHFAIVPEWIIDAQISDCAYRLYSVLLRFGQTSGQRMPARATLAARLHKSSKDTVDRALKELVGIGAVVVERRRRDGRNLTNRYLLMSTPPEERNVTAGAGGRIPAATAHGRFRAATPGRRISATVAADLRPDPESLTENPPTPSPLATVPPPAAGEPLAARDERTRGSDGASPNAGAKGYEPALLAQCGIDDLPGLARDCQALRRGVGAPTARWTASRLLPVIAQATKVGGWPQHLIGPALRALAADPATRSPMRLAYPGPWWDIAETGQRLGDRTAHAIEQQRLESRLAEADGGRVWAQQQARAQLSARGEPVTRLSVARLACELLDRADLAPC